MSGRIIYWPEKPAPRHVCDPPPIHSDEIHTANGAIWLCDCGTAFEWESPHPLAPNA